MAADRTDWSLLMKLGTVIEPYGLCLSYVYSKPGDAMTIPLAPPIAQTFHFQMNVSSDPFDVQSETCTHRCSSSWTTILEFPPF